MLIYSKVEKKRERERERERENGYKMEMYITESCIYLN